MARPDLADDGLVVPHRATSTLAQQVELCAPCHSRRTELGDYDHTGDELLDHHAAVAAARGAVPRRRPDPRRGLRLRLVRAEQDVRATTCAAATATTCHSLKLRHEGNELCLQCHRAEVYDTADHHFHKKIHEGKPSDGALCVKCHMPEQPYMVIDWRADHSLRVPRPDLTRGARHAQRLHPGRLPRRQAAAVVGRRLPQVVRRGAQAALRHDPRRGARGRPRARRRADPAGRATRSTRRSCGPRRCRCWRLPRRRETDAPLQRALLDDEPLLRHTAAQRPDVAGSRSERVELLAPLLFDPVRAVRLAAVSQLAGTPDDAVQALPARGLPRGTRRVPTRPWSTRSTSPSPGMNLGNLYAQLGDADRGRGVLPAGHRRRRPVPRRPR